MAWTEHVRADERVAPTSHAPSYAPIPVTPPPVPARYNALQRVLDRWMALQLTYKVLSVAGVVVGIGLLVISLAAGPRVLVAGSAGGVAGSIADIDRSVEGSARAGAVLQVYGGVQTKSTFPGNIVDELRDMGKYTEARDRTLTHFAQLAVKMHGTHLDKARYFMMYLRTFAPDCEIVVNDDVGRAEALMSKYATAP